MVRIPVLSGYTVSPTGTAVHIHVLYIGRCNRTKIDGRKNMIVPYLGRQKNRSKDAEGVTPMRAYTIIAYHDTSNYILPNYVPIF